jgi:Holliday junction resolvasome RuvABC endonuclease subunit
MKLDDVINKKSAIRVIGIDPSTNSLAFAVVDRNTKGKVTLQKKGKINFKGDPQSVKFKKISSWIQSLDIITGPFDTQCVIEQTIFIQNPQTSRLMAYITGYTWGRMIQAGIPVSDIGPMKWKSWLGYKKVTKAQKEQWAEEGLSAKDVKKKANFERKHRTRLILEDKGVREEDDDIMDAVGIALWGVNNL